MFPNDESVIVHHHAAANRYEAVIDGLLAVADYQQADDRLVFTHTFVPPGLRNRGVAAALIRTALDDARRNGRRVEPRCSYVARFIARHPEYRDLVA